MTTELHYLAWAALLTGSLWIPYVIAQVAANGFLGAGDYRDPTQRPLPLWGQRANRAHINAVESFAPFAAMIFLIQITGAASETSALWAAVYFWSRVVHTVVFLLAIPFIRTVSFTVSWIAVVVLFWAVIS